jgi:hypothetical protein
MIGKPLRCILGFHKWEYSKKLVLYDISPSPYDSNYLTPTRRCINCALIEKWIPGYGGSEIGHWTKIMKGE